MNQPQASLAIQVLPKASSGDELLRIVDKVIEYIKSTGLVFFVGPFETTVEGGFDTLCSVAKQCMCICITEGAESVSAYTKFVYNPNGGVWSISQKTGKYHGADNADKA